MTAATTQASSPIRIVRLAHMRYRHANIAQTQEFLEDFGMRLAYKEGNHRFYFAGDGPDPFVYVAEVGERSEFLGGTFLVETKEDLERASQLIPGATSLQSAGPAGGYMVTFRDPDGIPCNLAWGLAGKAVNEETTIPLVNFPTAKPRRGEFIRFKQKPCPVFKLGHFGLLISDFQRTYDFYTKHFNLKATDLLTAPDGSYVAGFMHIDRGEEWVDHHTFFFSTNSQRVGPHHCSYEVHDSDIQAIGHDWLLRKGYTPSWGIGRHILGSQVFDYWYTPDDFMVEHYSDGDLVNCHTETGLLPAADEALAIWGPAVPEGFMSALPCNKKGVPHELVQR
ncbi:hypothetical protein EHS25_000315 [Saitozyma podzolica]|uniref:VOC domain-containing protein n=1 Tax=Saitozyma podzolica TaxID=1890683 RepID=A0A427YVZ6_9TREE|nr:hypothetical protein EHS25_000315 [Saitozyma podzolica]